jgi:hypothetical protein
MVERYLARALTPAMQPQAFSLEACGRARLQPCRNLRPFLFCHYCFSGEESAFAGVPRSRDL